MQFDHDCASDRTRDWIATTQSDRNRNPIEIRAIRLRTRLDHDRQSDCKRQSIATMQFDRDRNSTATAQSQSRWDAVEVYASKHKNSTLDARRW